MLKLIGLLTLALLLLNSMEQSGVVAEGTVLPGLPRLALEVSTHDYSHSTPKATGTVEPLGTFTQRIVANNHRTYTLGNRKIVTALPVSVE